MAASIWRHSSRPLVSCETSRNSVDNLDECSLGCPLILSLARWHWPSLSNAEDNHLGAGKIT